MEGKGSRKEAEEQNDYIFIICTLDYHYCGALSVYFCIVLLPLLRVLGRSASSCSPFRAMLLVVVVLHSCREHTFTRARTVPEWSRGLHIAYSYTRAAAATLAMIPRMYLSPMVFISLLLFSTHAHNRWNREKSVSKDNNNNNNRYNQGALLLAITSAIDGIEEGQR